MKRKQDSIFKGKSWNILCKVRDAIKVNVFIAGIGGNTIIPPESRRYGGSILADPAMGFDLRNVGGDSLSVRSQFGGKYFELKNRFNLHCFGVPVFIDDLIIGNIIVGPIMMNKRLSSEKYVLMAREHGLDAGVLINNIHDIRVVSNVDASSMLGLVHEIAVNNVAMAMSAMSKEIDVNFKGFLKSILKFANVECGSVMAIDRGGKNLIVKAVEGMDKDIVGQRIEMGKGISGIAAKEKESFLIESKSDDNRIAHLFKRTDIRRSLVLPLVDDKRVCGVLNIHTKKSSDSISANLDSINYFSELFAKSAQKNCIKQ